MLSSQQAQCEPINNSHAIPLIILKNYSFKNINYNKTFMRTLFLYKLLIMNFIIKSQHCRLLMNIIKLHHCKVFMKHIMLKFLLYMTLPNLNTQLGKFLLYMTPLPNLNIQLGKFLLYMTPLYKFPLYKTLTLNLVMKLLHCMILILANKILCQT